VMKSNAFDVPTKDYQRLGDQMQACMVPCCIVTRINNSLINS
jgi:hypothetical protein